MRAHGVVAYDFPVERNRSIELIRNIYRALMDNEGGSEMSKMRRQIRIVRNNGEGRSLGMYVMKLHLGTSAGQSGSSQQSSIGKTEKLFLAQRRQMDRHLSII